MLSITETGATILSNDGSKLSYFSNDNNNRIAYYNNSRSNWWTRSPESVGPRQVCCVLANGNFSFDRADYPYGVRPTFIVDSSLKVDDNGYIVYDNPLVISSSLGTSGTDLGEKKDVFDVTYSVSDSDGDVLTVTEKIDNIVVNTRENISSGSSLTFSNLNNLASF